jgi:three-Cys-motif partner protein
MPEEIVSPDGEFLPKIKPHSLEKIRRHNYYAALVSNAMRRRWPQRLYVGLYSGAGLASLEPTGEIVETSALSVVKQAVPFTKYIFVDSEPECLKALEARITALGGQHDVSYIHGDVNEMLPEVIAAVPPYSRESGLLSLCFIDPFRVDLKFEVIRQLSRFRMDFLVMLPLGYDLRRNLKRYLEDADAHRVGELIDDLGWRDEWLKRGESPKHFIRFLLTRFDEAMVRLGYRERTLQGAANVKVAGMGVFLYALTLYSRHELGEEFWRTTLDSADDQLQMDF